MARDRTAGRDVTGISDRNTVLLNGYTALRNLQLIIPVFVPFCMGHIGLSFHEIVLSEAAFAATMVLIEIPSGWLADHWQRRRVMILGGTFMLCGTLCLWGADGFWTLLLAQVLFGLGVGSLSGADVALLYDSLAADGREKDFLRLESRRFGIGLYALAGGSFIAGWVYSASINAVFIVGVVAYSAAIVLCIALVEPPRHRATTNAMSLNALLTTLKVSVWHNRRILLLVLFSFGFFSVTKGSVWLQQGYLLELDVQISWFGPIAAMGFLFGALATHIAPRLAHAITAECGLITTAVGVTLAFAIAGFWPGYAMITLLFAGSVGWGLGFPLVTTLVQQAAAPEYRATVQSVISLSFQLAFIPLADGIGRLADHHGADAGYLLLAGTISIVALPAACVVVRLKGSAGGQA